jgi:hypothetical protein
VASGIESPIETVLQLEKGARPHGLAPAGLAELAEDHVFVNSRPVVEVIEVDGVEDFSVVRQTAGAENFLTGFVVMVVADDGIVEFCDDFRSDRAAVLLKNPSFQLRIGRFFRFDEIREDRFIDAESGEDHGIVTAADCRIVRVEFSGFGE